MRRRLFLSGPLPPSIPTPSHRVSRRVFARSSLAATALLAMPVLQAQGQPELRKVTIAVGGKAAFCHLPLTISEQLGYFKAEGLDVSINDFAGCTPAVQALQSGAADVCAGSFERTIQLQSKKQWFQAFVQQGRTPQIAFGVSIRNLPSYFAMADLKGKKIGISDGASSTSMLASLVLGSGGLAASDVSFVNVGTSAGALLALRSGQIDAICNFDPVMTMLEQKGEVRIISDTRTLKGTTELFGGPMPAACLFASAEFIRKNPDVCQALAHAVVRSLKWLQTAGPGDIIKTVPESYLLEDRAIYLASFNKVRESISLDGMVPEDGGRTALRALAKTDAGFNADRIDLSRAYTNAFALRAKQRFRA